ncbi:YhgE/Pip domain-containing protein [Limosilactobacillus gastricus]|nr:ABC transporter permease [Limosilactobacillus gastricus]
MFEIFKNKMYWLYLLLVAVVIAVFSFAMIGSRSTVKVQQIPVAVVDLDHSTTSQQIVKRLKNQFKDDDATLKLTTVNSQKQLTKDFNHKKYYGAIVIKKDFAKNLASQTQYLQSMVIAAKTSTTNANAANLPQQAGIDFQVNAGANATVSSALTTAFTKMGQALSTRISQQELSVLTQNNVSVATSQLSFLTSPIKTTVKTVHPIKDKTISGMLPLLITAISWMAGLITSILL